VYSLFTWIRCSIESLRYIFFPFLTHSFGLNKILSFTGIFFVRLRSSFFVCVLDETLRNCHYICVTHTHTIGWPAAKCWYKGIYGRPQAHKPRLLGRIAIGPARSSSAQTILSLSLTEFYIYFSSFFPCFSRRDMAGGWTSKGIPMYMYALPICVDPTERAATRLDRVETRNISVSKCIKMRHLGYQEAVNTAVAAPKTVCRPSHRVSLSLPARPSAHINKVPRLQLPLEPFMGIS
jgi:hypothetical protein